jgi:hypothetical protein
MVLNIQHIQESILPKPLQLDVKSVLAEYGRDTKIREAMHHAWGAVKADPDNGWWRRKSTRAANVWEHTVDKAIELFADDPGIEIIHHYDTVSFVFDGAILVRFKKAGITLHTSNVQTALAELFHDHQEDLFGYQGLQRVEAVYVLNRFESEIMWTGVVAREQDEILWHFELADESIAVEMLPLQQATQATTASLAKLKNQPKDAKKRGNKDGE